MPSPSSIDFSDLSVIQAALLKPKAGLTLCPSQVPRGRQSRWSLNYTLSNKDHLSFNRELCSQMWILLDTRILNSPPFLS